MMQVLVGCTLGLYAAGMVTMPSKRVYIHAVLGAVTLGILLVCRYVLLSNGVLPTGSLPDTTALNLESISWFIAVIAAVHAGWLLLAAVRFSLFTKVHLGSHGLLNRCATLLEIQQLNRSFQHDIRQPLNTIGILSGVGKTTARMEDHQNRYAHIQAAQKSLIQLLNYFTDEISPHASVADDSNPEQGYSLKKLLDSLAEEYSYFAQSKKLTLRCIGSDITLFQPKASVSKLVRNGLDNAIKYTESGFVLIAIRHSWKNEATGAVRIDIIDSGPGVDNKAVDPSLQGWGYGTQIIRDICSTLGAELSIGNRRDGQRGTRLSINLPVANQGPTQREHGLASRKDWSFVVTDDEFAKPAKAAFPLKADIFKNPVEIQTATAFQRAIHAGNVRGNVFTFAPTVNELQELQSLASECSAALGIEVKLLTLVSNLDDHIERALFPNLVIIDGHNQREVHLVPQAPFVAAHNQPVDFEDLAPAANEEKIKKKLALAENI